VIISRLLSHVTHSYIIIIIIIIIINISILKSEFYFGPNEPACITSCVWIYMQLKLSTWHTWSALKARFLEKFSITFWSLRNATRRATCKQSALRRIQQLHTVINLKILFLKITFDNAKIANLIVSFRSFAHAPLEYLSKYAASGRIKHYSVCTALQAW